MCGWLREREKKTITLEPQEGRGWKYWWRQNLSGWMKRAASLPRKDDGRHFWLAGCSLSIKVHWLYLLHWEWSERSHLLGLQFHPVPAALIKPHTPFPFSLPPNNFTFPPTVFFSAVDVSSLRSLYLHFAPPPRLLSCGGWVCNLSAKASVTRGKESASAYWHGASHHPGSAQLPGRCCCGPCVSSSCIGTAWTWLPGERTMMEITQFAGIRATRKRKKKRCIELDENDVAQACKSCFFPLYNHQLRLFSLSVTTHVHFI